MTMMNGLVPPRMIQGSAVGAYPNVVPFTMREGITHIGLIEEMRKWITDTLTPFVNDNINDLGAEWVATVDKLVTEWDEKSVALVAEVSGIAEGLGDSVTAAQAARDAAVAARNLAEQYASQAEAIQDVAISGIIDDVDSATFAKLASLFATEESVSDVANGLAGVVAALNGKASKAVEETITSGRLSASNLDALYKDTDSINVLKNGAIGDGIADDTDAINDAIANAPDGATVIMPRGATFRLEGSIVNNKETVNVIAHGATFIQATTAPILKFEGGYVPSTPVTAIGSVTIDAGVSAGMPGIQITTATNIGAKIGDVLKVYSDDKLVGTTTDIDPAPASAFRAGQFGSVQAVNGNTITLTGSMRDPMTTNIRVSKLTGVTTTWIGGTFIGKSDVPSSLIQFISLVRPTFQHFRIPVSGGQAISVHGCYGYEIDNFEIDFSRNDPNESFYGYGIDDNTNEYGIVSGGHINQPRHGYSTTVSGTTIGQDVPSRHGRTFGTVVRDMTVQGATSTAYDTHSNGEGVSFINCTAEASAGGFALRGRFNRISNCYANNVRYGLRTFADSNAGESYGHVITNLFVNGATQYVAEFATRFGGDHPNLNVLERRPIFVNGIFADNLSGGGFNLLNTTVRGDNLNFKFVRDVTGATIHNVTNSHLQIGKIVNDFYSTNGAGAVLLKATGSGCLIEVDKFRVSGSSQLPTRITTGIQNVDNPAMRIDDFAWDYLPVDLTKIVEPTTASGYAEWRQLVGVAGQKANVYRGSDVSAINVNRVILGSSADTIQFVVSLAAAASMATFPVGRIGQVVNIINRSSFVLTIPNGGTIATSTGANLAVAGFKSVSFVFDNAIWRQVVA